MMIHTAEEGWVLIGALLVGLLLAMLGGTAMNLAVTEVTASSRHVDEKTAQLLAESGVEQVMAWLTQGALPASHETMLLPVRFTGTLDAPDVTYDAGRPEDDRVLNNASAGGALADFGRVTRVRLYGPGHPDGYCALEVTAEARGGSRRTVAVELGIWRIPPLRAAVQADVPSTDLSVAESGSLPKVQTHWGEIASNSPPGPWQYQTFKDYAQRFGSYYVPDREGRLYRNGMTDPSHALTPSQVFGSQEVGDQRGLVFIDTLDQQPPNETNQVTLVLEAPYMEGTFYINAHVVLQPQGTGQAIQTLTPLPEGQPVSASPVPVSLAEVTIKGVLYTTRTLRVDTEVRVFGAVVAERGLAGAGPMEVWYNNSLGRGRVEGLPVVFPIRGTWREQ
ncbi:MAG: hypothetical protein E6K64_03305 [Nitrospirae bacterium]|nr:MAG: hypothetical protein E6K64_03305 [Nitrospirota bacterium]